MAPQTINSVVNLGQFLRTNSPNNFTSSEHFNNFFFWKNDKFWIFPRMDYKTFSCFQNFVKCNQSGVPDHTANYNSLQHLNDLLKQASEQLLKEQNCMANLERLPLEVVGFSKGCVVLNQFLYEFHYFKTQSNEDILNAIRKITDMYWLDGGHSGGSNTWITNKDILQTLTTLDIKVHVHVSPYQIRDDRRPWIRKEEKAFSEYLSKHCCRFSRQFHFDDIPPSILTHFDVISAFK